MQKPVSHWLVRPLWWKVLHKELSPILTVILCKVSHPNATLLFKYVGFKDLKKKVTQKGASVDLGIVKLEQDAVMLNDVTITSSIAFTKITVVFGSYTPGVDFNISGNSCVPTFRDKYRS